MARLCTLPTGMRVYDAIVIVCDAIDATAAAIFRPLLLLLLFFSGYLGSGHALDRAGETRHKFGLGPIGRKPSLLELFL